MLQKSNNLFSLGSLSKMASQSCDVTDMVNVKVEAGQRVAIAERVAGRWEDLAAYLAPGLFTNDRILVIKKDNQYSQLSQAKTMLEMWSDQFGTRATCGLLIKGLLDIGYKAEAAEVFPQQLVDFVSKQCKEAEVYN